MVCYQRAQELDTEIDGKDEPVTLWRAIDLAQVGGHGEVQALLAQPQPSSTWQEFRRSLLQVDTLLWLDRWDEGAAALDRLLAESRPPSWTSRELWVIGSLVLRTQNPQVWRCFIALWLDCFARHGRLTELGEALVRSLRYCAVDWVTDQTAQAWCAAWRDLAGDRAELALPLRLPAAGTAEARLLDGLAQTLFDLVESGTIRLDTPAAQSDYTRFFFNVLRAREGRFQVMDAVDDLPLAAAPPPEAQAAHPWELERLDQDGRPVYAGTVLFVTNLFRVTLALHPRSGRVEMLAGEPIAEALPIRREGFDGPIRYLAEAGSTAAAVP